MVLTLKQVYNSFTLNNNTKDIVVHNHGIVFPALLKLVIANSAGVRIPMSELISAAKRLDETGRYWDLGNDFRSSFLR
jgi:hypothetical protein